MNEAVENGVGIGWIANDFMPAVDGKLRRDHGGAASIAVFKDFKEIMPGGGIERLQSPVIQDEKIGAAQVAQKTRMTSISARQGKVCEEPGDALIEHRPVVTAGFVAECRGKPALASTGRSRVIMPATTVVTAEYAIDSILSVVKLLSLHRAGGTAVTFS